VFSVLNPGVDHNFRYHNATRWTGPWSNPNDFGELMGVGFSLNLALLTKHYFDRNLIYGALGMISGCFLLRGLVHSYSRGGWLATLASSCLVIWIAKNMALSKREVSKRPFTFHLNLPILLISVSLGVMAFWQLRDSESIPVRRLFSAGNPYDFSWRNRLTAWRGALVIAGEAPMFGLGWNKVEPYYRNYIMKPYLVESTAIEMNDYLLMACSLGLPALLFLAIYIQRAFSDDIYNPGCNWTLCASSAGALVLCLSFCFDAGLFRLPTSSIFWLLLALGYRQKQTNIASR
jgi:hypothetical protein